MITLVGLLVGLLVYVLFAPNRVRRGEASQRIAELYSLETARSLSELKPGSLEYKLLAAGVRIALFEGGLLHTKSLTIDGEISLFGSVNLDMRSIWLNFEISLIIVDAAFTARLNALQDAYLRDSSLLDPAIWHARPGRQVFLANAFRLLGPLI